MAKKFRERFKTFENVFDQFTLRNLFVLGSRGHFDGETLSPLSIGKEANVFTAERGDARVVVKIYRLETADFKRMFEYIKPDPRYRTLIRRRRETIFAWAQREYRNLMAARRAQVSAPLPIAFMKNVLVMSMIGDGEPAQKIKDSVPLQPKKFLDGIADGMAKLHAGGFVHGDLSKFNILNRGEAPVFIDFSQASPVRSPHAEEMLRRDARNVCGFFSKLGVNRSPERLMKKVAGERK